MFGRASAAPGEPWRSPPIPGPGAPGRGGLLPLLATVGLALAVAGCATPARAPSGAGTGTGTGTAPGTQARTSAMPPGLTPAIRQAERDGAALYAAEQAQPAPAMGPLRDAFDRLRATPGVPGPCANFAYRPVAVWLDGAPVLFLLARAGASAGPGAVVVGRHYRLDAARVTASSYTCLAIPVPAAMSASSTAVVTHLLSPTPSEFHVYLSLASGHPLMVATSSGLWFVERGRILYAAFVPDNPLARPHA